MARARAMTRVRLRVSMARIAWPKSLAERTSNTLGLGLGFGFGFGSGSGFGFGLG